MTEAVRTEPSPRDPLERGRFTDGHTKYTVRASSASAPDSFQVFANDNCADIVMIVSGLISGHLHATWGQGWRTYAPDWKVWIEDAAFRVFYNSHAFDIRGDVRDDDRGDDNGSGPYRVRFCDG